MKIHSRILIFAAMLILTMVFMLWLTPLVYQWLFGYKVIYSVPAKEKVVALTYDDGPHPVFTPKILNILTKYHIKATFFMVGKTMEQYPAIVKQVIAGHHVIGNHTYNHPHNIKKLNPVQIASELDQCEQVIRRMTGNQPYLFRPPLGLMNRNVLSTAQKEGYRVVLWSVCANRRNAPTPKLMAEHVIRRIKAGTIILIHDGSFDSRWKDVEATSIIIESLVKKGYRFVTVSELLQIESKSSHHLQSNRRMGRDKLNMDFPIG